MRLYAERSFIRNKVRIANNVIVGFTRRCPLIASALSKDGPDEITIDLVSERTRYPQDLLDQSYGQDFGL